jgi:hypothetical protein
MEHNGYFFNLNFEKKKSKILFVVLKSLFIVSNVLFFKPRSVQKKCGQMTWHLLLFHLTYVVASSAVKTNGQWCPCVLQKIVMYFKNNQ